MSPPEDDRPTAEEFDLETQAALSRLERLEQRARSTPEEQEHLEEALKRLSSAVEEMRAAQAELQHQNEELVAEQALLDAERRRYRELFDTAPEAYIVTDPDGNIEDLNQSATRLLGWRQQGLVGKPLANYILAGERRQFRRRLGELRTVPRIDDWMVNMRTMSGGSVLAAVTVEAVRESDQRVAGLRWLIRDAAREAAERRLMEEELSFRRALLESQSEASVEGIVVVDSEGAVINSNRRLSEMWGIPDEVLATRSDEAVFSTMADQMADPEGFRRRVAELSGNPEMEVREDIALEDGRIFQLHTAPVVGQDGSSVGRVWFFREVTADRGHAHEREELLGRGQAARSEAEAASARLQRLQALTDVMLRHVGVDELLNGLLDALRESLGTDTATILLITPDGKSLAVRAVSGEPEEVRGEIRVPIGMGIAGRVASERRPRIVENVPAAGPYSKALRSKVKSLVAVPLMIGDRVTGVVHAATYVWHKFTQEDVKLLQLVAERAAVAIENATLYGIQQQARWDAEQATLRMTALQGVTASLSEALTTQEVARIVVDECLRAGGAVAGLMALLTSDGEALEVVRAANYPEEMLQAWQRFPLSARLPLSDAVRSGVPVILESTSAREERYPDLKAMLDLPDHALVALPMRVKGRTLGGLVLRFAEPRRFDEAEVAFMMAMARQASLALERARLYEAERQARSEAESAQLRLAFLAEAGAILSGSLQMPDALTSLGRLAVTFLTDLCLIDVVDEKGHLRRMVAVHTDAEKQPLADLLRTRYSPDPAGPHPAAAVVETGRSQYAAEMPEEFLRRTTLDEEHYRIVRELGFQSYMCVPLVAGGGVKGCITLVSCTPNRRYGPRDVALAEELARRAGLAFENALLFSGEQRAREAMEVVASRLSLVAEASEVLASSLDYQVTLQRLARLAIPRLADWCLIDLLGPDGSLRQVALAHRDPSKETLAKELRRRYPPERGRSHPVWRVLLSGEPLLDEVVSQESLAGRSRDAEHLSLLNELGIRSHIVVPLRARGRTIGAVSLIHGESGRHYTRNDLLLAQDLARRVAVSVDNARLYEGELAARAEAERAKRRVEFLSEATASLSATLPNFEETLEGIGRLAVPALADHCRIDMVEEDGSVRRVVLADIRPPGPPDATPSPAAIRTPVPDPGLAHPVNRVLRTGRPVIVAGGDDADAGATADLAAIGVDGATGMMVLPLVARQRTLGAITLARTSSAPPYVPEDGAMAQELARRAALVLDNARLYDQQRHIAQTLQRSLLPASLPTIPGMELAAKYRAAGEGNEVGGDFYEAFETADGAWVLAIGDVCGKGAEAAAITGLARHTLRAVALHEPRPSRMLSSLNQAILRELSDERFCTVCCMRVRPGPSGIRLTICSGGHPLPLILRAEGTVEPAGKPSMLLGVLPEVELTDHAVDLFVGDTIVLFTDGVTEETRESGRPGAERLEEVLRRSAGLSASAVAEAIEGAVIEFGPPVPRDDFAILVLRVKELPREAGAAG